MSKQWGDPRSTAKKSIDFLYESYLNSKKNERKKCDIHKENEEDNFVGLGFYGGEPLLCFDLIKKCIKYFESLDWGDKRQFHNITTNGSILNDEIIDFMLTHNFVLNISLDGPKEENDRNRVFKNGKGTFERVISNLERLKKKFSKGKHERNNSLTRGVSISCVTPPNCDLIKLKNFFNDVCDNEFFNTTITLSSVEKNHISFFRDNPQHPKRKEQLATLMEEYIISLNNRSLGNKNNKNAFLDAFFQRAFLKLYKRTLFDKVEDSINVSPMCFPGKRKPQVRVDGSLHVCEQVNGTMPIGELWNGFDFRRISDLWNQYAEIMNMKDCRSCWAVRLCDLCFKPIIRNGKFEMKKKLSDCENIRSKVLYYLINFCSIQEGNPKAFDHFKKINLS